MRNKNNYELLTDTNSYFVSTIDFSISHNRIIFYTNYLFYVVNVIVKIGIPILIVIIYIIIEYYITINIFNYF